LHDELDVGLRAIDDQQVEKWMLGHAIYP
jgi:hypothetical protein